MRFSENRPLALGILALCVILSLTLSGGGALKNQRDDVANIFYYGASGDGLCIDRDLTVRSEAAYNLASTAALYQGIDAALVANAKDAGNALAAAATIEEKAAKNEACQRAVEDLYTALDNAPLSEPDRAFAYKQYKEFQSRKDTISRDPYNQKAEEFNDALSGFPARFVGGLIGVRALSLFE